MTKIGILFTVFLALAVEAKDFERLDLRLSTQQVLQWEREFSVFNSAKLRIKDKSGFSVEGRFEVNGEIDTIDSEKFELDKFVKELSMNYEFDTEVTALKITIGKVKMGTQTDASSAKDIGGVMGVRLTIKPHEATALQQWLKQGGFKIRRIEITRYNSQSKTRVEASDLNDTDMTGFSVYFSRHRNLHAFIILKEPDQDSYAPQAISVGGAYHQSGHFNPQYFALFHQSQSRFVDLKVLILSGSFEVIEKTRLELTWSFVSEGFSGEDVYYYEAGFSRKLYESERQSLEASISLIREESNLEDTDHSLMLRLKHKGDWFQ